MLRAFAWTIPLVSLFAGSPQAAPEASPLRPMDLLEKAERFLHRTVEIEIVEPLDMPDTMEALSRSEYGQVEVRIPEAPGGGLALVPSSFRLEDPKRYHRKFDRVFASPVRVRGELLRDEELSKDLRRPAYVIRVAALEPLSLGSPEPVRSLAQIQSDPARWDRKLISYEGVFQHGFEILALDRDIWLETEWRPVTVGHAADTSGGRSADRVRVTGILFARPGAHYGHLGAYKYELVASKVQYLGAASAK